MKNINCFFLFSIVILSNCAVHNNLANKNYTDSRIFNRIYQENNNAFYISHTKNHNTIWTYKNSKIDIYKLKNSHILQKYSLPVQDYRWISDYKKSQKFDVDKCAELDGSIIGFKIIIGNQLVVENLAMNIDCIGNNVYESNFLNQLSKTIKQFELGKF